MYLVEIVSQLVDAHRAQLPLLLEAATSADGHEPVGEHKFLRIQQGSDVAAGLLALEGGRVVGYAHTMAYGEDDQRRVSSEIVVHPEVRRRGIGRALLAKAVEYARSQRARRLDLWAYNDNATTSKIAGQFGFVAQRRLFHLHRHMRSIPVVNPIPGIRLRTFVPGVDDERWLTLNNRVFDAHPEQGRWTLDDMSARMAQPWFNADDMLLLDAGGALAGFCWIKIEERPGEGRVGEIYVIGTAPEFQGRGLGRYLVSRALSRMHERRANVAAVYVDESNVQALALYESSGFHYHHVDVCYALDLPSNASSPTLEIVAA